jgi:hypothetical protein
VGRFAGEWRGEIQGVYGGCSGSCIGVRDRSYGVTRVRGLRGRCEEWSREMVRGRECGDAWTVGDKKKINNL